MTRRRETAKMDLVRWGGMHRIAALGLAVLLAGCAGPTLTASAVARALETDFPFELAFELPKATWTAAESIAGRATLSLIDGASADLSGSGSLLNFEYAEVGGTRRASPVWTAICAPHSLAAGQPISSGLGKSGTWQGDAPSGDFNREFMTDPLVRLPPGTWDITALASFSESPDCSGPAHDLEVTVRITVTD